MTIKSLIRRILSRRGFALVREPGLWDFLTTRNVDLVIDVGANEGQFGKELRSLGYSGDIYSFEPVPAVFKLLARRAAADAKWSTFNVGVGAAARNMEINVSQRSVLSSFRPLTTLAAEFDSQSTVVRKENVAVVTLDDQLREDPHRSIFLKVDTQGYEQEVLAGAGDLLSRCVGIQLELPVDHLYEGVWSFHEAITSLDDMGFVPAQFRVVNKRRNDRASAIEFDAVFRRKD